MDNDELMRHASDNRRVFEQVLEPYVALKIANVAHLLERGARNA